MKWRSIGMFRNDKEVNDVGWAGVGISVSDRYGR